jgi:competence protein ComEA
MFKLKYLLALTLLIASLASNAADVVNLNSADADTLAATMVGIGPAKAAAIVAYREQHGPFKTVDDLLLVQGIGESTLAKNRDRVTAASN